MKILVFGKTGQVATELQRQAEVIALGRDQADLADPDACAAAITAHRPDAVINAAAYTAVDRAETDEPAATVINGVAPGAMARACATLGIPFVHISTDYVFAGTGTEAWRPDDAVDPLNAYGRSKLAGEQAVVAAGGTHGILRTSWVFSSHGANFVKTMLRLGATRDTLTVVADQIGGPTPAAGIAATCLTMARALADNPGLTGIHHYSGAPDVSWADFARAIFAAAGMDVTVTDIPGSQFPTPAARPSNSRLDCSALARDFSIQRPDWRAALHDVLTDLEIKK
jgi:dTDP-4-dehydrorhamnose reductase